MLTYPDPHGIIELAIEPMPAVLPDNFEAVFTSSEERRSTVKGMVLRQQLLRLAMKGLDATKAASVAGCSRWTARAVYREPDFRKEVYARVDGAFVDVDKIFVESKASLHEMIAAQAYKAFDELKDLLESRDTLPSLRAKIAMDFLDRNPESQAGHTVAHLNPALQSEALVHAARIAREVDGKVVEMQRRTG